MFCLFWFATISRFTLSSLNFFLTFAHVFSSLNLSCPTCRHSQQPQIIHSILQHMCRDGYDNIEVAWQKLRSKKLITKYSDLCLHVICVIEMNRQQIIRYSKLKLHRVQETIKKHGLYEKYTVNTQKRMLHLRYSRWVIKIRTT